MPWQNEPVEGVIVTKSLIPHRKMENTIPLLYRPEIAHAVSPRVAGDGL